MTYQVLARKWRPKDFRSVVGQSHVVRALQNALQLERLHHAYLFVGTRGVGKTTLARIFAKCLNCESGMTDKPCGQCSACQNIDQGSFVDLIEIDAASRTGVDDMRDLLETVQYSPSNGRFKIYLIDEVHMLSISSFNALLKTLEEPPPHIKFFFATTDPQKLPVTVLSRCLKFNLTRLSNEEISTHLEKILQEESVTFEEDAVKQISFFAEGSVRDALSLLDQAIAYGNGSLQSSEVEAMLGIVGHEHSAELLQCVISNDIEGLFAKINQLYAIAVDFSLVLVNLITLLNEIAIHQVLPRSTPATQFKTDQIDHFANSMTAEEIQLFYQIALHGKRDLPLLPDAKNAFEMTLMRLLSFRPVAINLSSTKQADTNRPSAGLKKDLAHQSGSNTVSAAKPKQETAPEPVKTAPEQETAPEPVKTVSAARPKQETASAPVKTAPEPVKTAPEDTADGDKSLNAYTDLDAWMGLINALGIQGADKELCVNGLLEVTDDNAATILINKEFDTVKTPESEKTIQQAFDKFFSRAIRLKFHLSQEKLKTPQRVLSKQDLERYEKAKESIHGDDLVKGLQENLGAKIIANSIKPT